MSLLLTGKLFLNGSQKYRFFGSVEFTGFILLLFLGVFEGGQVVFFKICLNIPSTVLCSKMALKR